MQSAPAQIELPSLEFFNKRKEDVVKDVTKDVTKELTDRQIVIIEMIKEDAYVTTYEMSQKTGVVTRTIKRDLEYLQSAGFIIRIGVRKEGKWIIISSEEDNND